MEKNYQVTAMNYVGGKIVLTLTELIVIPPEEIERARLEAELREKDTVDTGEQLQKVEFEPPKTDTQRIVKEITDEYLKVMRREVPGAFEALGHGKPGGRMIGPAITRLSKPVEILVTPEEYEALGSPPILARIRMTIERPE